MMMSVMKYEEQSKQHHPTQSQGQATKAIISECETSSLTSIRSSLNIHRALNPSDLTRKRIMQCNPQNINSNCF